MTIYTNEALRALALHTQRLDWAYGESPAPTPNAIYEVVEQLGAVQIDTLNVVARSHYLVLWSRFGSYDTADFERLIYRDGERRLFEHWRKAACIIPLTRYRYQMAQMDKFLGQPNEWWQKWLADQKANNKAALKMVLERIRKEGPLRSADFKYDGPRRDSWWDWKPAKHALEYQFAGGNLMIADRVNFQRVYDLTERVLPDWVDTNAATLDEARRFNLADAVRAAGVCQLKNAAFYAYLFMRDARPHFKPLVEDGTLVEIKGELADGSTATLVVHKDNVDLLAQAADGALTPRRTTFLSYFDSVFWATGQGQDLWGFRNVLEAYKKAEDRMWGYFSMPILYRDRLVGRFDPKHDRETGQMILKHLHLEDGVKPEEEMVGEIAHAMRDFMAWQGATELVIEESALKEFGAILLKAM